MSREVHVRFRESAEVKFHCATRPLCESFFATLECERIDRRTYRTHADARLDIFQFIEGWYNPHRRHSALGQKSPINFENLYYESHPKAEPVH